MLGCKLLRILFFQASNTHKSLLICASFVDRDMLMRYVGGGVGHGTTADASTFFGRRSFAYSQDFADRRAKELADLEPGWRNKGVRMPMQVDEPELDSDGSPDEGEVEHLDDSDFTPDSDDEDDDFAYTWHYQRKKEGAGGDGRREKGSAQQPQVDDGEVEDNGDGEEGGSEEDEVLAFGYDHE